MRRGREEDVQVAQAQVWEDTGEDRVQVLPVQGLAGNFRDFGGDGEKKQPPYGARFRRTLVFFCWNEIWRISVFASFPPSTFDASRMQKCHLSWGCGGFLGGPALFSSVLPVPASSPD